MALKVMTTGDAEYGKWIKALIAGDPGSGKTRTSSTWPDAIYASAEGGLLSIRDRDLPAVRITETADLLELYKILAQAPEVRADILGKLFGRDPFPVRTVVIDTLDEVQRLYIKERNTEKRQETMTMQDWGWLGDQMRNVVRAYRNLEMNVILTCHIKKSEDGETNREIITPQLAGAFGDEVAGFVDLAVLLTARPMTRTVNGESVRQLVRVMQTYPDRNTTWLKDRSGRLPMELEIDFDNDYRLLHDLIFGGEDAGDHSTVVRKAEEVVREAPESVTVAAAPTPAPAAAKAPAKKAPAVKKAASAAPAAPKAEAAPAPAPEPEQAASEPVDIEAAAQGPDRDDPPEAEQPTLAVESEPEPTAPEPEAEGPPPGVDPETGEVVGEAEAAEEPADGAADPNMICEECGREIESVDDADFSWMRYRKHLCREHFAAMKNRKPEPAQPAQSA